MAVFRVLYASILAAAVVLSTAGCGQRGPLYLPEDSAPPATPPTGQAGQDTDDPDTAEDETAKNATNPDTVHSGSFEDGLPH